jgi:Transcription factor S-II (TFIIS), central domain/SPOC domain
MYALLDGLLTDLVHLSLSLHRYHLECIGLTKEQVDSIEDYVCFSCQGNPAGEEIIRLKANEGRSLTSRVTHSAANANTAAGQAQHVAPMDLTIPQTSEPAQAPTITSPTLPNRKRASDADLTSSTTAKKAKGASARSAPSKGRSASTASAAASGQPSSPKSASLASPSKGKGSPAVKASGSATKDGKKTAPVSAKGFAAQPASSSKNEGTGGTSAPTSEMQKNANDPVRTHAINQFAIVLEQIFRDVTLSASSPTIETTFSGVSMAMLQTPVEQRTQDCGRKLEEAMWAAYAEPHPKTKAPAAGKAYRDRLRTLLFNLKDKNNNSLHARIATGSLTPEILATLPGDQLANDAIRQATEKAKKEALEQSILKKDTSAPLRRITHKGEEDIEIEVGNQMHSREEPKNNREEQQEYVSTRRGTIGDGRRISSLDVASPSVQSPTLNNPPHSPAGPSGTFQESLYARQKAESPDRFSSFGDAGKRSVTPNGTGVGSPTVQQSDFDLTNVFTAKQGSEGAEDDTDMENGEDDGDAQDAEDVSHGHDWSMSEAVDADDIMDALDGPSQPQDQADTDQQDGRSPSVEVVKITSEEREVSPPKELTGPSRPVWSGAFTMPEEATFSGTARQIAGRPLGYDPAVWEHFFPVPHATFDGRLPSKVALDYLVECNAAPRTELIVLSFEPSLELNALAAAGDEAPMSENGNNASFAKLLSYLHERGRYGVIPPSPFARGKIIKDFYIAPLMKDDSFPPWLEALHPKGFRQDGETNDMYLLVAVLNRGALEADLEAKKAREAAQKKARAEGASAASMSSPQHQQPPPQSFPQLVPGGGDALQNLLKAVGKGASADHSISQARPSGDMHLSRAPAPSAGNQLSAPTAAALQQMPTAQLESFLHANPVVVDQLLNSLKASGGVNLPPGSGIPAQGGPPHMHPQAPGGPPGGPWQMPPQMQGWTPPHSAGQPGWMGPPGHHHPQQQQQWRPPPGGPFPPFAMGPGPGPSMWQGPPGGHGRPPMQMPPLGAGHFGGFPGQATPPQMPPQQQQAFGAGPPSSQRGGRPGGRGGGAAGGAGGNGKGRGGKRGENFAPPAQDGGWAARSQGGP